jgi:pyruvate/2-oxoglutarate dehydrogenase complex dihydrolipoamide dehydrogenase (E3) component
LRLVPLFPFFAVYLAMGVSALPARTFYWVSQIGMLPATIVFVNAGTELAQLTSTGSVLTPGLLVSFTLLGVFPLLARKLVDRLHARRVHAGWPRPRRFDRNLVVIGAGAAGLSAAYIAAALKARVTLIERHWMGGDCLNTGCVPSKALLRSAKLLSQIRRAGEFGIRRASAEVEFADVMERVARIVRTVEPHDSVERYTRLGVECIEGEARITSPWTVEVRTASGTRSLSARAIVIAAGARPVIPPIPGIDQVGCLTSETLWSLRELPRRLLVLGGGPVGCELAQAFARFGSKVTLVQRQPRILVREDPEISERIAARFRDEGIELLVAHQAERFVVADGEKTLVAAHRDREAHIAFDALICAVGRAARTAGYGLEELGIPTTGTGAVETNEFLQTRFPGILACGDVVGPFRFTHVAAHQAWYATINALFGRFWRFPVDYSVIPWATFTDPEVARVGLNEIEAKAKGIDYEVTTYAMDDNDRAIADGEPHGVVKVLTVPGRDRILGATIVGERAGESIAELVAAMKQRIGLGKILGTIHVYPTLAEANKYVAGEWRRRHAPAGVLRALARYHAMQTR